MACARGLCTADKVFVFINIAFAMYSGALLATAARLAWDPSTYAWFRFLCAAQYRVSAAYVLGAGVWLAALVALAAAARGAALRAYAAGVACLAASELAYGAWMAASLAAWWRSAPQAELARRGMDLLHDLKPALLAVDKYRDVARPILDMIEEVEREAPNNAVLVLVLGALAMLLQVAAFVMARRLARRPAAGRAGAEAGACACGAPPLAASDDDSDADAPAKPAAKPPAGWRKNANLRMYTILDKIF
ncbi:uncharacterized protein LOC120629825 [Pararge aegeria]|uniref:uncharacterized protein LOC120629825 n=1 Tax=Pararge aegeria TaxID=116150 RepID=UPI0019CFC624|nr:uncharacterized protein LOC120629825 [Pararge aegeria]